MGSLLGSGSGILPMAYDVVALAGMGGGKGADSCELDFMGCRRKEQRSYNVILAKHD